MWVPLGKTIEETDEDDTVREEDTVREPEGEKEGETVLLT